MLFRSDPIRLLLHLFNNQWALSSNKELEAPASASRMMHTAVKFMFENPPLVRLLVGCGCIHRLIALMKQHGMYPSDGLFFCCEVTFPSRRLWFGISLSNFRLDDIVCMCIRLQCILHVY